jgi:hypothetical protein
MLRRKIAGCTRLHAQRHWAQPATLQQVAGRPSGLRGVLLLSRALE